MSAIAPPVSPEIGPDGAFTPRAFTKTEIAHFLSRVDRAEGIRFAQWGLLREWFTPRPAALPSLLDDVSQVALGGVPRVVTELLRATARGVAERYARRIKRLTFEAYGLDLREHRRIIHRAETLALATFVRDRASDGVPGGREHVAQLFPMLPRHVPLVEPMTPWEAEQRFLQRLHELCEEREGGRL